MGGLFKTAASAMTAGLLVAAAPPLGSLVFSYSMSQKLWILSAIGGVVAVAAGSILGAVGLSGRLDKRFRDN